MDLISLIKVKNSRVILSGILIEQEEIVYDELVKEEFENICINRKGEWACLTTNYM